MKPATVFIVDDDPSVRRALQLLFDTEGTPSQSFDSAEAFIEQHDPHQPGCLLLDVRMPGVSGLELQETLAARGIVIPIVFMTAYADVPMTIRALKGGAVDFVEKPFNEQLLLEAVNRALEKDADTRRAVAEKDTAQRRVRALTPRERQVLERVVAGQTNREIAAAWGISEKTIKIHRARVMEKMHAESLPQLVLLAQSAGIHTTNVVSD